MIHLSTAVAAAEAHVELPIPAWAYGAIALVIFAVMLVVTWSFEDVANRHSHRSAPDAAEHVGAPGASHHGSGHPMQGR